MTGPQRFVHEAASGAFLAATRPGLCMESVLLRLLEGGPVPANELWRHARVSKRAMRAMVNAAARKHLVAVEGGEVRSLANLPPVEPASCVPLQSLVSQFELEHPHFPVPYGAADPRFAGGGGADWRPVPRDSASRVEGLPMTALLSELLVAFALAYEREHLGPIQWAANALRCVDGLELDDPSIPRGGPHSVPHLQRKGVVTVDRAGIVRLTAKGQVMRDGYGSVCERVQTRWRERFGSRLLEDVAEAVEVDGEGPAFPLIVWTGAEFSVLTEPSAAQ